MTAQARKIYKSTLKLRRIGTAPYMAAWKDIVITVANFLPKTGTKRRRAGEKQLFLFCCLYRA